MEAKVNVGNYQSVTVSLGATREIRGKSVLAIGKAQEAMFADINARIAEKVEQINQSWSES